MRKSITLAEQRAERARQERYQQMLRIYVGGASVEQLANRFGRDAAMVFAKSVAAGGWLRAFVY